MKPAPAPRASSLWPAGVVSASFAKWLSDCGDQGPIRFVERLRRRQPEHENDHQRQADREDRGHRRRAQNAEGVVEGMRQPVFAAPAHLIEPDGGEGANQRVAGKQRKQQRQHVSPRCRGIEKNADHEIDEGEKEKMRRHRRGNRQSPREALRPSLKGRFCGRRETPEFRRRSSGHESCSCAFLPAPLEPELAWRRNTLWFVAPNPQPASARPVCASPRPSEAAPRRLTRY